MSSDPITDEKSPKMPDIKFKDELTDIASGSTIHGIANIFSTNSAFKRILWILAFLACVTLVIRQLVDIFILYSSFPIITSFKHKLYTEFPAFTVCNLNKYRHSKHEEFKRKMEKLANEEYARKLAHNTRDELCILDEIYCSMTSLVLNITRSQFPNYEYELGHQIDNMFIICQLWRNSDHYCSKDNYTRWRSTRYGNCYTFELKTDVGIMDGLDGGINLIFNLEIHENTTTDFEPGIRFVVHPRGVVAMPHDEGITIKGGERAIIGITQTGIHRLQTPKSPCRTNDRHFGGIYDMKACRKLCRETIIQEECGCYEFDESISLRTPSIADTCKNTNFDCFKRVQGDLALNLGNYCDCPVACRETNLVLSDVREPAFKSNSLDDRSQLNMMSNHICGTIYGAMPQRNCPLNRLKRENTLTENFVKIKLYFKEPAYGIWSEEAAYDQIQMLADIGGSLGLFIGASVLSFGELLEVVGMCVRALIRRRQSSIHTVDQIQETQPEKLTLDNIDCTNDIVKTK